MQRHAVLSEPRNPIEPMSSFHCAGVYVDRHNLAHLPNFSVLAYWADHVLLTLEEAKYGEHLSTAQTIHSWLEAVAANIVSDEFFEGARKRFVCLLRTIRQRDKHVIDALSFAGDIRFIETLIVRPTTSHLLNLVNEALSCCKRGDYLSASIFASEDAISSGSSFDKIRPLARTTAHELLSIGMSPSDAQSLVHEVFDGVRNAGTSLETRYPIVNNVGPLHTAMALLTSRERMHAIVSSAFRMAPSSYVLFLVNGIKIDQAVQADDCYIFNPKTETFVREPKRADVHEPSTALHTMPDLRKFPADCRIAVRCSGSRRSLAVEYARGKLSETLDKLSFPIGPHVAYRLQPVALLLDDDRKYITTEYIDEVGESVSRLHAANGILAFPRNISKPEAELLRSCLRWKRKGDEATHIDDRCIAYWTIFEKLAAFSRDTKLVPMKTSSPLDAAQKVIPYLSLLFHPLVYGQEVYRAIIIAASAPHAGPMNRRRLRLVPKSRQLRERYSYVGRYPGEQSTVTLAELVNDLPALSAATSDALMSELLTSAAQYFSFGDTTENHHKDYLRDVTLDLEMLYEVRNLIIHQGHCSSVRLQYAAKRSADLATKCLAYLFRHLSTPAASLSKSLLFAIDEQRRFKYLKGSSTMSLSSWPLNLEEWPLRQPRVPFLIPTAWLEPVPDDD